MDKKEEELLSMHYQIEKTDIKQQQLEDRLGSISKDLDKSKTVRNLYFVLIVLLLLITAGAGFYLVKKDKIFASGLNEDNSEEIQKLLVTNDSLKKALHKLKEDVAAYQNQNNGEGANGQEALDSIQEEGKLKFERIYCYITKAYESNDATFIEADFIEFYEGRKAVMKAKEFGEAEYDIDKDGDTLYYLYNNYYINNQNSKSRILELDDKARVRVDDINQISNGFPLKAFQRIIKKKQVFVLETNNGVVYSITQKKLP